MASNDAHQSEALRFLCQPETPPGSPASRENAFTAAHTSPIYVSVNHRLPAVRDSAKYMAARVGVALNWVTNEAQFSTAEYRQRAVTSFRKAKEFYEAAEQRATK